MIILSPKTGIRRPLSPINLLSSSDSDHSEETDRECDCPKAVTAARRIQLAVYRHVFRYWNSPRPVFQAIYRVILTLTICGFLGGVAFLGLVVTMVILAQLRYFYDIPSIGVAERDMLLSQLTMDSMADVRLVLSMSAILAGWYNVTVQATNDVLLSTYAWKVDRVGNGDVNNHVKAIGYALLDIQKRELAKPPHERRPVTFRRISNQIFWSDRDHIMKKQIDRTIALWQLIGLDLSAIDDLTGESVDTHGIIRASWYTWSHRQMNNIHGKFIIVDGMHVCMHSNNVEGFSHGERGSWRESGAVVYGSPILAAVLTKTWYRYADASKQVIPSTHIPDDVKEFVSNSSLSRNKYIWYEKDDPRRFHGEHNFAISDEESVPLKSRCPVYLSVKDAEGLFGKRNDHVMSKLMVGFLQNAKSSITVATPNFNDVSLLSAIRSNSHNPTVRVMVGKLFNHDHVAVKTYLLGWLNTKQMIPIIFPTATGEAMRPQPYKYGEDDKRFLSDRSLDGILELETPDESQYRIKMRYYVNPETKKPCISWGEYAVHAKLSVFDDEWVALGSFNMDVLSMVHPMETELFIQSKEAAAVVNEWYDKMWDVGRDVLADELSLPDPAT
eukprot:GHVN01040873.1.p1 GENE.GHVN01040873.1~~GHVN01040873.1.p1  ORF type:complete len:613 (+),score=62.90 GHVN01040873.1:135-1973(+)